MADARLTDDELDELLDRHGAGTADRRLHRELVRSAFSLAVDVTSRLDLKITAAALDEMHQAFRVFAPYRDRRKVTIFGSARTRPDDPLYAQARDVAADLASRGWMVVTGAGPGIMAAGTEGAGTENAFGVTIRLPFEEAANEFIAGDDKLVDMKYFFTRKLMLVKESAAFIALPGGFGTQDETFELCTLQQTGKAEPAPIVLLDTPGGTYWTRWVSFVRDELLAGGLISPGDLDLFTVTDDPAVACDVITAFHRNYDSVRWVGDVLVIRVRRAPDADELADLNERHAASLVSGEITTSGPMRPEVADDDKLDLERVVLRFDPRRASRLRLLIDDLNRLVDPS